MVLFRKAPCKTGINTSLKIQVKDASTLLMPFSFPFVFCWAKPGKFASVYLVSGELGGNAQERVAWELHMRTQWIGVPADKGVPPHLRELDTLPIPFSSSWYLVYLHLCIFRIKIGKNNFIWVCKPCLQNSDLLLYYKCCFCSIPLLGNGAQNRSFCVCFYYTRTDLLAFAFPHQEAWI